MRLGDVPRASHIFHWKELLMKLLRFAPLFVVALLLVGGCPPKPEETKSLYDRLGGHDAVVAVVDDFVGRAAGDPKVNFTRVGHPNHWDATPENVDKLKKHLVQFVSGATGGPKDYAGKDMAGVHA